jgi:hypothetical protein
VHPAPAAHEELAVDAHAVAGRPGGVPVGEIAIVLRSKDRLLYDVHRDAILALLPIIRSWCADRA